MKKTAVLSTIFALTLALFSSQAQAKMIYGKVGVGLGLVGNLSTEIDIPGFIEQSEDTDLATGFPIMVAVGVKMSPMMAIEGEFSYRSESPADSTGSTSLIHLGANLVLDVPLPLMPITPYFGGGALLLIPSSDGFAELGMGFSLQFFGGVSYAINPLMSVGVDLRYLLSVVDPGEEAGGASASVGYSQLAAMVNLMFGF